MDLGTGITVVVVVAFSLLYFYDLGRRHERRYWLGFIERHGIGNNDEDDKVDDESEAG